jgi:pimeloyl-ACP methyl ester carboxylesterase
MKTNILIVIVFTLLTTYSTDINAQGDINYGSNNGKYLSIYGTKIYYEEYGKGTALLLCNGGLSTITSFVNIIPELSKHFRVIVADPPGEGRSELPDTLSFDLLEAYASKMIDLLHVDSLYVYGYSLGGSTALRLAADRPDKVKMTVVHSGAADYDGLGPGFGGDKVMPEMMEANPKFWLDEHLSKSPQKDKWKKYIQDFNKIWLNRNFVPTEKLAKIRNPVLIIQGDHDIIKPEHALQLFRAISGSQLCILPGTTHFVLWEDPDLIKQPIVDFLLRKGPVMRIGM